MKNYIINPHSKEEAIRRAHELADHLSIIMGGDKWQGSAEPMPDGRWFYQACLGSMCVSHNIQEKKYTCMISNDIDTAGTTLGTWYEDDECSHSDPVTAIKNALAHAEEVNRKEAGLLKYNQSLLK